MGEAVAIEDCGEFGTGQESACFGMHAYSGIGCDVLGDSHAKGNAARGSKSSCFFAAEQEDVACEKVKGAEILPLCGEEYNDRCFGDQSDILDGKNKERDGVESFANWSHGGDDKDDMFADGAVNDSLIDSAEELCIDSDTDFQAIVVGVYGKLNQDAQDPYPPVEELDGNCDVSPEKNDNLTLICLEKDEYCRGMATLGMIDHDIIVGHNVEAECEFIDAEERNEKVLADVSMVRTPSSSEDAFYDFDKLDNRDSAGMLEFVGIEALDVQHTKLSEDRSHMSAEMEDDKDVLVDRIGRLIVPSEKDNNCYGTSALVMTSSMKLVRYNEQSQIAKVSVASEKQTNIKTCVSHMESNVFMDCEKDNINNDVVISDLAHHGLVWPNNANEIKSLSMEDEVTRAKLGLADEIPATHFICELKDEIDSSLGIGWCNSVVEQTEISGEDIMPTGAENTTFIVPSGDESSFVGGALQDCEIEREHIIIEAGHQINKLESANEVMHKPSINASDAVKHVVLDNSICIANSNDFCNLFDNCAVNNLKSEEAVNCESEKVIVFERRNPKRAASSRSIRSNINPGISGAARNGVKGHNKVMDLSVLLLSRNYKVPKNVRTNIRRCRHVKPSRWGSLDNLIHTFISECELSTSKSAPTWLTNKASRRRSTSYKKRFTASKFRNAASDEVHLNGQIVSHSTLVDSHTFRIEEEKDLADESIRAVEVGFEEINCGASDLPESSGRPLEKGLECTLTPDKMEADIQIGCFGFSSCLDTSPAWRCADENIMVEPGLFFPDSKVQRLEAKDDIPKYADRSIVNNVALSQNSLLSDQSMGDAPCSRISSTFTTATAPAWSRQSGAKQNRVLKSVKKEEMFLGDNDQNFHVCSNLPEEGQLHYVGDNCKEAKSLNEYDQLKHAAYKDRRHKSSESLEFSPGTGSKVMNLESSSSGLTDKESSENLIQRRLTLDTPLLNEESSQNLQIDNTQDAPPKIDEISVDTFASDSKSRVLKHNWKDFTHIRTNGQELELNHGKKKGNRPFYSCDEDIHIPVKGTTESLCMSSEMAVVCDEVQAEVVNELGRQHTPRTAWVCCDDCQKWRRIPAALVDILDEANRRWTCKENEDTSFADCSIPQEMTNAEINAELELSDAYDDNFAKINLETTPALSSALRPAPWAHIRTNIFLHRNRKNQSIDEALVCNCKPPTNGQLGCRDGCLNRILCIECVKGTCPCGEVCSNRRFQKRNYAKLRWCNCAKKGFGLQLLEDVSEGQFLIEYVGEVLDFPTYEARQQLYASRGQKHYYFMALSKGEVIDACLKGNLGRFINHSCKPNCRTEKWIVNGEVCIGFFAAKDIKKGEELTFDYNYVRVAGAAAQKCFCASAECRGFIGGEPLNGEIAFDSYMDCNDMKQLDKDMRKENASDLLNVNGVPEDRAKKGMPGHLEFTSVGVCSSHSGFAESPDKEQPETALSVPEVEISDQNGCGLSPLVSESSETDESIQSISPTEIEDVQRTPIHISCLPDEQTSSILNIPRNVIASSDSGIETMCKKVANAACTSGPYNEAVTQEIMSISNSFSDQKSSRKIENILMHSKVSHSIRKTKAILENGKCSAVKEDKMPKNVSGQHLWGVEEKLNRLLDNDGGISRRKHATNGYLKLLLVTATEGENNGVSNSGRDISMILEALLMTKSQRVLTDILNQNGLQMLHNILKQNRSRFVRTPVLRKLVKVLTFLAQKGVLTPKLINKAPPCIGMESFRESMLGLANHADIPVHRSAREFRDKWIPRMMSVVEPIDRPDSNMCSDQQKSMMKPCHSDTKDADVTCTKELPVDTGSSLVPLSSSSCTNGKKRKCQWDNSSNGISNLAAPQTLSTNKDGPQYVSLIHRETCFDCRNLASDMSIDSRPLRQGESSGTCLNLQGQASVRMDDDDDELPPGFVNQQKGHKVSPTSGLEKKDDQIPPGFGPPHNGDIVPPGFESHVNNQHVPATYACANEVPVGYMQESYIPRLTISYGIPANLSCQLGIKDNEAVNQNHNKSLKIAVGIPFHPFPPLPPYPRGESSSASTSICDGNQMLSDEKERQLVAQSDVASLRCQDRQGERRSFGPWREQQSIRTGQRGRQFSNYRGGGFPRPWSRNHKHQRRWPPCPVDRGHCNF